MRHNAGHSNQDVDKQKVWVFSRAHWPIFCHLKILKKGLIDL